MTTPMSMRKPHIDAVRQDHLSGTVDQQPKTYYYHFDGLGSVIALTNSSGSVVNLYEYSVYGEVSASDPNHPNRFLFTGREFDKDTGLYYYRARYYNPYIGRFLQTDPIGYSGGMNPYAYCHNSAINAVDPLGLYAEPTIGPSYLETAAVARERTVRNGDSVSGTSADYNRYFPQVWRCGCAATALANLYQASGEEAKKHVCDAIAAQYPASWRIDRPENAMEGYFLDYLEQVLGYTDVRDLKPDPEHGVPPRHWDTTGIFTLGPVARIINEVGGLATYKATWTENGRVRKAELQEIYDAILPAKSDGTGGKGKPVIVAFRTGDATGYMGPSHHVVVVRYCPGAQTLMGSTWVDTPYEIVDGEYGNNYEQLYFTQGQFERLVDNFGGQAVLP